MSSVTKIWDGTTVAEVDALTGYLVGIDIVHHKAHEGGLFSTWAEDTDVDIIAPKQFWLKTGAKEVHWSGTVACTYGLTAQLYDMNDSGVTSSGTAMDITNHYDGHANTPTAEWYEDATFSGGTTSVIAKNRIYGTGSNNNNRVGGEARSREEQILQPNHNYLVTFTVDADTQKVFFNTGWYEVII